jgi:hypothetical protein
MIFPRTASQILDGVKQILAEREKNYDHPKRNFKRIAQVWTPLILNAHPELSEEFSFTALDVARMMVGMKMVRDANKPQRDNWDDTIGYGTTGAVIEEIDRVEAENKKSKGGYVTTGTLVVTSLPTVSANKELKVTLDDVTVEGDPTPVLGTEDMRRQILGVMNKDIKNANS